MKKVLVDQNNFPVAFYDDQIHEDIPSEALDISDTHWGELISHNGAAKFINNSIEIVTPVSTTEDVSFERDLRIAAGQPVTISDGRTFTVQTRDEKDFRNINGLVLKAILLQSNGDTTTTITFRDADDNDQTLTASQMIEVGTIVGDKVDNIYKKSWTLKAMSPIPDNFRDNLFWV